MTPQWLLDTSILVEWLRGRSAESASRFDTAHGRAATSTVTAMELEYGCARSRFPDRMRADVESLLGLMRVLPFDQSAAREAGRVRAELAAAGSPIGPFDSLIAGHARSLDLTVVTGNVAEFTRVRGLRVENWLARPGAA
jgi:tRNA(fMet)-specific endonuclease VapC